MPDDHEDPEIAFIPEHSGGYHIDTVEAAAQTAAEEIGHARADVIRAAGYLAVGMIPLVVLLSFIDSILRNTAWILDDRILYVILAGLGSITVFAWKTKQ